MPSACGFSFLEIVVGYNNKKGIHVLITKLKRNYVLSTVQLQANASH